MTSTRLLTPEEFPPQCAELPQKPKQLSMRGAIPDWEAPMLAVVGSRRYTSYGKQACEKIIGELAGSGIVIVSGLALGIDAIAHEAAMKAGLTTIAFPGSGLAENVLYPSVNRHLAKRIVEHGGALISEYPDTMRSMQYMFPARNRLMAGIARGVLVIEAEEKSGTRITARLATEYNKDVFAVPGSIFSITAGGPNALLKQGAIPITCGNDILTHWGLASKEVDEARQASLFDDCSPEERCVLDALREPLSKDDLTACTALPIHELNVTLSVLEIRGLIAERLGKVERRV